MSSELRVGIFVTSALLVGGILVFVIGGESTMLSRRVHYEAIFPEVDGLRSGSPVRIGGVTVGAVDEVEFTESGAIRVDLWVSGDTAQYVREGSAVSSGSKGLLGDELVDITVGSGEPLAPGSTLPVQQASLLTSFLGETGEDAEGIVSGLRQAVDGIATEETIEDIRAIAHNLATLSALVVQEDGAVATLLEDEELALEIRGAIGSLRETSAELGQTMRSVRGVVREVERGDGTLHQVIYGDEGTRLLVGLADTAGEAATILRDVRTGDNNAHELLYGDGAGNLVQNLTDVSEDLAAISGDVRAGRGTIGGLLVDPSIYEDIRRLVGDLQRNEILRSLVRYSIREDAQRGPVPEPRSTEGETNVIAQGTEEGE
jgi:phospholipid/cholesterol/gamma-HCH transport system substrate-binding protein